MNIAKRCGANGAEIRAGESWLTDGRPDIAEINPILGARATCSGAGKLVREVLSAGEM